MVDWLNATHVGCCRKLMRQMIADGLSVNCVVTSPPYWALRDYGMPGQFGLERTWVRYVARMRGVFRLVHELLADDGTLWLNCGDSYAGAPGGWQGKNGERASRTFTARISNRKQGNGLKPKDLVGIPWRVALALQADGWWLRSEVIWAKPNPMPESIDDRPTKSHEHIFLLAKSEQYHYDGDAIREASSPESAARAKRARLAKYHAPGSRLHSGLDKVMDDRTRNARSVWTISTQPFAGAHFATFPEALVTRCILAGSRPGDIVFDPFMGSGTVAHVATHLGRRFVGCELNPAYIDLHQLRRTTIGMPI